MHAVSWQAIAPAIMAFNARREKSVLLPGASWERPAIWMPIDIRLAKPHSAYVDSTAERLLISPSAIHLGQAGRTR